LNYKIIFERAFNSDKKDIGDRELAQVGDHVTFLLDDTFRTREIAAINGAIITTKPFLGEKRFMFERKRITGLLRPLKDEPVEKKNTLNKIKGKE
jgi:hypothetical protein